MNHYIRPSKIRRFFWMINWPRLLELACWSAVIMALILIGIVIIAPEGWRGR